MAWVGHDRQPSAFAVYLLIWRRLAGSQRDRVHLSHQAIAEATGLSKSAVQAAVATLVRRQLIAAERAFPTATPEYRLLIHWRK
jgi:DNA-binding IclR family transcriptional regulator